MTSSQQIHDSDTKLTLRSKKSAARCKSIRTGLHKKARRFPLYGKSGGLRSHAVQASNGNFRPLCARTVSMIRITATDCSGVMISLLSLPSSTQRCASRISYS